MGGRVDQAARLRRRSAAAALAAAGLTALLCGGCSGAEKRPEGPPPAAPEDAGIGLYQSDQADEDGAAIVAVEQAVNALGPAIRGCWSRGAADDFRLEGRVVLAVRVGQGGAAEAVEVVEDGTGDAVLTGCLTELWSRHRFPPEAIAAGQTVQLPMEFVAPTAQHVIDAAHVAARPLGAEGPAAASTARVVLHPASTGNDVAALSLLEMAPGLEVPLHRHTAVEVIYVLSGTGVMTYLRGPTRKVGPGDAVYIDRGAPHGLRNTGKVPVVAVQLYAPAGPEQRFLGKPPVGTEPVSAAEKKRGGKAPRPLVRATKAGVEARWGAGATVRWLFDPGPVALGALTVGPGASIPAETDRDGSWFLHVLEGGGVLTVAGEGLPVGPGASAQVPSGFERGLTAGEAGLKALVYRVASDPNARWRP